ncbi:MAG: prepilin peptidase, partial [Candidatus Aenigmarchaeota archaeon]|nr:prepilin peptidase [Candidatus Aenigmarchaeota archaeon]
MIEIPFAICSALTLFAGLYDLKTSDVHEEVPALLISFGLFYWFMFSMISNDLAFFFNSVATGLLFLSVGLLLYKIKAWGDGDAWIMGGIGFMVPKLPVIFLSYPMSFMFNLMIIGGIYSLFYIIIYGILNINIRKDFVSELKKYRAVHLGFL